MALNHKTVTEAARAASQANGAKSRGPRTEKGKKRSKMNALKHGKYAQRPTAAELLLAGDPEKEQAEREALRREMVRRYQPADSFAAQQAEELADLHFELGKIQRAQQVIWERERELLELEQGRRRLAVRRRVTESCAAARHEVESRGLLGVADTPSKLGELLVLLDVVRLFLRRQEFEKAESCASTLYGSGPDSSWRGEALLKRLRRCRERGPGAEAEPFLRQIETILDDETEEARQRLELCELEQGELGPAGQAARLLEATHSRRWAWVWQQETFLRRAIDRKVRILIDLRSQGAGESDERDGAGDDSGSQDEPARGAGDAAAPSPSGDILGDGAQPPGQPARDSDGLAAPASAGSDPEAGTPASNLEGDEGPPGDQEEPENDSSENAAKPGNDPIKSFEISEGLPSAGGEAEPSEGTDEGETA
jgi:hypothetical protein